MAVDILVLEVASRKLSHHSIDTNRCLGCGCNEGCGRARCPECGGSGRAICKPRSRWSRGREYYRVPGSGATDGAVTARGAMTGKTHVSGMAAARRGDAYPRLFASAVSPRPPTIPLPRRCARQSNKNFTRQNKPQTPSPAKFRLARARTNPPHGGICRGPLFMSTAPSIPPHDLQDPGPSIQDAFPSPDPDHSAPSAPPAFLSLLRTHRFDFFAASASLSDQQLQSLAQDTTLLANIQALTALAQACLTLHAIAARTAAIDTLTPLAQSNAPDPEQRRAADALTRASNLRALGPRPQVGRLSEPDPLPPLPNLHTPASAPTRPPPQTQPQHLARPIHPSPPSSPPPTHAASPPQRGAGGWHGCGSAQPCLTPGQPATQAQWSRVPPVRGAVTARLVR